MSGLDTIRALIRTIPGFPHEGILFRDVMPLLADPEGLRITVEMMARPWQGARIDKIAAAEARGFIIGGALARRLSVGFVPIRKQGKLPGEVISQSYQLEYGEAVMEMQADALRPGAQVLLIDDLLATGGTAKAGIAMCHRLGATVLGAGFIVELPALGGRGRIEALGIPVQALCAFDGA